MPQTKIWTVAEAKSRLSEVLRRASKEPQRIGARQRYVVVPEALWKELTTKRPPLGTWLALNMPRGSNLAAPSRLDPPRPIPFAEDET